MTEIVSEPETAGQPEPSERGRYAVYQQADGGALIARANGICQTCSECGCGEQMDPIAIPAAVVAMARMAAEGKMKLPSMKSLAQMARQQKGPARAKR